MSVDPVGDYVQPGRSGHLLAAGFQRSNHWMHSLAVFSAFASDFVKPVLPYLTGLLIGISLVLFFLIWLLWRFRRLRSEILATTGFFFLVTALLSLIVLGVQKLEGYPPEGIVAHLVPSIERLQVSVEGLSPQIEELHHDLQANIQALNENGAQAGKEHQPETILPSQTSTALLPERTMGRPFRLSIDPDDKIPVLDKSKLVPAVERAVILAEEAADMARRSVIAAQQREFEWQAAANRADQASQEARNKTPGYAIISIPEETEYSTYSGQVVVRSGKMVPDGYGVAIAKNSDKYLGHWNNGRPNGPGIRDDHHYGTMATDWTNGKSEKGYISILWRFMFVGEITEKWELGYTKPTADYALDLPVVYKIGQRCLTTREKCYRIEVEKNGNIYAGQVTGSHSVDKRCGFGALFDKRGHLVKQGTWNDKYEDEATYVSDCEEPN